MVTARSLNVVVELECAAGLRKRGEIGLSGRAGAAGRWIRATVALRGWSQGYKFDHFSTGNRQIISHKRNYLS